MIEVARSRAGGAPVEFLVADAGAARFSAPFDLVFSRFGVMFFADPVAAFSNLRAALAPPGRMTFLCWRALRENPWAAAPMMAARDFLPPMEPSDPHAPGPFAFADGERLRGILAAAGFQSIDVAPHDDHMYTGASVDEATDHAMMIGPLARAIAALPDQTRAALRPRIAEVVAQYAGPHGVTPPAAVWLVSARASID
jgi:SAM-dependent methyltransferase